MRKHQISQMGLWAILIRWRRSTIEMKKKPLKIKVTYKQVEMTEEARQKMERAYDILFDEVLKRRIEKGIRPPF